MSGHSKVALGGCYTQRWKAALKERSWWYDPNFMNKTTVANRILADFLIINSGLLQKMMTLGVLQAPPSSVLLANGSLVASP